ncbi:MAG: HAD-IA family hydrolase [Verrucomicrobiota bacterium]
MDLSKIRAVSFDAADTLLHVQPSVGEVYQEIFAEYEIVFESDELQTGFRTAFKNVSKNRAILNGEKREIDFWRRIVAKTVENKGIRPTKFDQIFEALWSEFAKGSRWRIAEGGSETLCALRERGYQIALTTNWDKRVRSVLEDHQLATLFDALIISSEIGYDKPAPEVFRHAARTLDVELPQLLHIGDSFEADYQGAANAGCLSLHLRGAGKHSISKLSQLIPLLPS